MTPANPPSSPESFPPTALPPDGKARAALAHLEKCADTEVLRVALLNLCNRFGHVDRLDILASTQAGGRQALCFLRMTTEAQELRLMKALGVGRFGGDVVVVVNLPMPVEAPRNPRGIPRAANNSEWMSLPAEMQVPPSRRRGAR